MVQWPLNRHLRPLIAGLKKIAQCHSCILWLLGPQAEEAKATLESERSRHQHAKDDLAMSLRVARKKAEVRFPCF